MIKGSLSEISLPALFVMLLRMRKTGRLTLHHQSKGYSLYFEEGKLRYITSLWAKDGLARIIQDRKFLNSAELDAMLQQESEKPLEQQLFQHKKLTVQQIMELMDMNSAKSLRSIDILMDGDFVFLPGKSSFPFPQKKLSIISIVISKTRNLTNLDVILPLLEPLDAIPELDREAPGFQTLIKIKLSAHEGFILSRIDGYLDFNKIFAFCGREHIETARFLLLLILFDLIKYNKGAQYVRSTIQMQFDLILDVFNKSKQGVPKASSPTLEETPPQKAHEDNDQAFSEAARESDEKIIIEIKEKLAQFPSYDYYQILDVNMNDPAATIKKSYFLLAKKFHPDNFYRRLNKRDLDKAEQLFDYIKKAYDTLINDEARKDYNRKINKGEKPVIMDEHSTEARKKVSSEYQYKQALLHIKTKDFTRAIDFLKAAHEFDPDNALVLAKYAEIEYILGRPLGTAEKYIKRAVELREKDGLLHLLYAKILQKRRRYDEALKESKRALLLEPENAEVRKMLQEIKQEKEKISGGGQNKKGLFGRLFNS